MGFSADGDVLILLGQTRAELSGSEWAWVTHQHLGGRPPAVDLAAERLLASVLITAAERGHLGAAHDLSDGGLAQALVEACLRHNLGATISLPAEVDPFVLLFAESAGRALVAVPRGHEKAFLTLCTERNLAHAPIGVVDGRSGVLEVAGQFRIPLADLRQAYSSTLPDLFGHVVGVSGQEDAGASPAAQPVPDEAPAGAPAPETDLAVEAEHAAVAEEAAAAQVAADTTEPAAGGQAAEPGSGSAGPAGVGAAEPAPGTAEPAGGGSAAEDSGASAEPGASVEADAAADAEASGTD